MHGYHKLMTFIAIKLMRGTDHLDELGEAAGGTKI
jgi:hypothetical protein